MSLIKKMYTGLAIGMAALSLGCGTTCYRPDLPPKPETFAAQRNFVDQQMKKRKLNYLPLRHKGENLILQVEDVDKDGISDYGIITLRKDNLNAPKEIIGDLSRKKGVGSIDVFLKFHRIGNNYMPREVRMDEKMQKKQDQKFKEVIEKGTDWFRYQLDKEGYAEHIRPGYGFGDAAKKELIMKTEGVL